MSFLVKILDPTGHDTALNRVKRPLYSWALMRSKPFQSLDVLPPDPWMGDAGRGRSLLGRILDMQGTATDLTPTVWGDPKLAIHPVQGPLIHGFEWLRDLRAMGGDQARRIGRTMLEEWLDHNRHWRAGAWDYAVTGNRIASWLMSYDFFCASADDVFQDEFYTVLLRQIAHLNRADANRIGGIEALSIIRGQIFAGLCLQQDVTPMLHELDTWLHREIDAEGMHMSRKPAITLRVARHLIDLRGGLVRAGLPAPTLLQSVIDRMMHATRFFRMPDQKLATLQSSQEGDADALEAIFRLSGVRIRKAPTHLEESGYESLIREKTHIIVDCGLPASAPFDTGAHASPLAFEMASGKERLVVSCGTSKSDAIWAEYLRATAAHSTLVLDDRNAFELIKGQGFGRRARNIPIQRDTTPEAVSLTMSHDGYVPLNGLIHHRQLMLHSNGQVLEGYDQLEAEVPLVKPSSFAVRFHLHPRVQASLIQEGHVVLLRLPSGAGWRFYKDNADLSLEAGIYCGSGDTPRKTQQIVLSGTFEGTGTLIRWQFVEGA